jgi:uncharacterized membrane protein
MDKPSVPANQTGFGKLDKILHGSLVERFVYLGMVSLPISIVVGFKTLRKMGVFGAIVSLLFWCIVGSFVATAQWTLIHKLIDKKPSGLPPPE